MLIFSVSVCIIQILTDDPRRVLFPLFVLVLFCMCICVFVVIAIVLVFVTCAAIVFVACVVIVLRTLLLQLHLLFAL